ncbi:MAG TPA: HyaD/HybD family hydrogenase maturation endopeptidase [Syntrophobacteraceae bacterium]|nr:HyaD/HybD family hydrogenase maturation endopeptidase [Syntrophobacteraceae bacterium]
MSDKHILVLGVGNILLGDEGTGVRVVQKLEDEYVFSENVELYDGGTLGLKLLEPICRSDFAIVVDIVRAGGSPGAIYRIAEKDLSKKIPYKSSLHELNIVETLIYAEELGNKPETVVIGIEPGDWSSWSTRLSGAVQDRMEDFVAAVLEEIEKAGGSWKKIEQPVKTERIV